MFAVRAYVAGNWELVTFQTEAAKCSFIRRCMAKGIAAASVKGA